MTIAHEHDQLQLATFAVGDALVGFDVTSVREVLRELEVTPVPHAPASITGLANIRGQIAETIDLGLRLALAPVATVRPVHALVEIGQELYALGVDAARGVVTTGPGTFHDLPVAPPAEIEHLVIGAFRVDGELVLLIDVERCVDLRVTAGRHHS